MTKILWFIPHTSTEVSQLLGITSDNRAGWIEGYLRILKETQYEYVICNISSNHADVSIDNTLFTSLGRTSEEKKSYSINPLSRSITRDRFLIRACGKAIEHYKPDIVHIQGTENPLGLLKRDYEIPFVISLQGILNAIYPRYFYGFGFFEILKASLQRHDIRSLLYGSSPIWNQIKMRRNCKREQEIFKLCTTFLGKTDFDLAYTKALNPDANYIRVPITLRPHTTMNKWTNKQRKNKTIFCLTSPHVFKGLGVLVRGFAKCVNSGIENVKLRIGGPTYPEVKNILLKDLKHYRIEDKVEFLGELTYKQVDNEYLDCDISVMPSFMENEPNSLFEALRLGIPCISTAVGGVPTLFTHGKELLLFNPGSHIELAGYMIHLLYNEHTMLSLSQSAINWHSKYISMTPKMISDIYSNLL